MSFSWHRSAVRQFVRARLTRRVLFASVLSAVSSLSAHAVVVRGRLTDPLGTAVPGGRVQLVQNGKVVAIAYAGPDGRFEIRSAASGRFTLLGSGGGFLPFVGSDFYGGEIDVLEQNVVLSARTIRQDVTVTATGIPTPLPQLTAPVTVLTQDDLAGEAFVPDVLRQSPGTFVVQSGQYGSVTSMFLRGGDSTSNLVLMDGIPATDVGGVFDYGTVSTTAVDRIEIYRGPDSAIYGTDADSGVVTINTPRGTTLKPLLNYTGDAGNLHTWQNMVNVSGTARRLDYYAAFGRFDSSNALPNDRFHDVTSAANLGYSLTGNTQLRFTLRNTDASQGQPGGYDFQGLAANGQQTNQDLYSGLTLENRFHETWHNLVRYGIARKREQSAQLANVGIPVTSFGYTSYYGPAVTLRGANGYTATGQASIYVGNDDEDSNRDQLYYQSDWSPSVHFNGLFGFRYDNERGSFNDAEFGLSERTNRTNFEYNLQFQGQFFDRLFYSAGGAVEKNHLYGMAGTPRVGLTYVPVKPRAGWFHGTRLRANVATGVEEPTLAVETNSLYLELLAQDSNASADIAAYHIRPEGAERSRTYDIGIDQNIDGQKLLLKLGYFHNIFDHESEGVSGAALVQYFGLNIPSLQDPYFTAYVNSLAFRAQGIESEIEWQAMRRLFVRAGYTYLDAKVLQSFASDALAAQQGTPTENPNLPGIAIGAESPLVGARPFRRPPHSGFFAVTYTRPKVDVALRGSFASRSDDSTYMLYSDINGGNSLLLPNRNLDFGYLKLDLGGSYQIRKQVSWFVQMNNLLNDQHIGPIGYPGLPFTFRSGLKVRLGGD